MDFLIFLVKALKELLGLHENICSLLIYAVVFVLLLVIVEPEKIKPIAYVLAAFIFGSGNLLPLFIKPHLTFR